MGIVSVLGSFVYSTYWVSNKDEISVNKCTIILLLTRPDFIQIADCTTPNPKINAMMFGIHIFGLSFENLETISSFLQEAL